MEVDPEPVRTAGGLWEDGDTWWAANGTAIDPGTSLQPGRPAWFSCLP